MAEPPAAPGLNLATSLGNFSLAEEVTYPNGGRSRYDTLGSTAIVIDYDICQLSHNQPAFDYSLITSKQNGYVAKYDRVYRFVSEDVGDIERFLHPADQEQDEPTTAKRTADRADLAQASPLEHAFEEHFSNVYGADSARYLWREYAITDLDGHDRYIDYLVRTRTGLVGVEENGVRYHHPQPIGLKRYREQACLARIA